MASPKHNNHHHHHRPAAAAAAAAATTTSKQQHYYYRPAPKQIKKQRPLVLRRAMMHSCVCFLVGVMTGLLAPSGWTDAASRAAADANHQVFRALHAGVRAINNHTAAAAMALQQHLQLQEEQVFPVPVVPAAAAAPPAPQSPPLQLVVVVTTTVMSSERERRAAGLTRTAHALRLVSPPVVWLVVEAASEAPPTARLLRRTGVVYRHLTYNNSSSLFTSSSSERHHQRNVALGHIEQHRLRGVVIFAGLADVYDLRLLEQLRQIRTVGAWPVATVWEQEKRVAVEGPVCSSSSTTSSSNTASSWFSAPTTTTPSSSGSGLTTTTTTRWRPTPPLTSDDSVHGFAFASDLLWDPARWDRFPTSEPDQSQDSIKFVQRLVMEDYNKTRAIPDYSNCSHIMVWRVDTTLLY